MTQKELTQRIGVAGKTIERFEQPGEKHRSAPAAASMPERLDEFADSSSARMFRPPRLPRGFKNMPIFRFMNLIL